MTDSWAADIAIIISAFGWIVPSVLAIMSYRRSGRNAAQIDKIEIATNSMKDALVKVTGDSERAKGVLQGRAAAEAERKELK